MIIIIIPSNPLKHTGRLETSDPRNQRHGACRADNWDRIDICFRHFGKLPFWGDLRFGIISSAPTCLLISPVIQRTDVSFVIESDVRKQNSNGKWLN